MVRHATCGVCDLINNTLVDQVRPSGLRCGVLFSDFDVARGCCCGQGVLHSFLWYEVSTSIAWLLPPPPFGSVEEEGYVP